MAPVVVHPQEGISWTTQRSLLKEGERSLVISHTKLVEIFDRFIFSFLPSMRGDHGSFWRLHGTGGVTQLSIIVLYGLSPDGMWEM